MRSIIHDRNPLAWLAFFCLLGAVILVAMNDDTKGMSLVYGELECTLIPVEYNGMMYLWEESGEVQVPRSIWPEKIVLDMSGCTLYTVEDLGM